MKRNRIYLISLLVCVIVTLGQQCAPAIPDVTAEDDLVFSDLTAALLSVTGTSDSDVYAVGADPGDGSGPYILRYDGEAWERLLSGATGDLWWISVTPIDGRYYLAGEGGLILSYDIATGGFSAFETPGDQTLFGIWGASSDALFAVGGDLDSPDDGGVIWRHDGAEWVAEDLSSVAPSGLPTLYKVWGRSASEVYVVGRLGTVLFFDGSAWSQLPTDTSRTLFTVNGNASEVIAVGGLGEAVIEELEGGEFFNTADSGLLQMNGVSVPSAGDPVAAGNDGSILRRGVGGWASVDTDFETTLDFHGVWIDPAGGIWAVGGDLGQALDDGMIAYIGSQSIRRDVR